MNAKHRCPTARQLAGLEQCGGGSKTTESQRKLRENRKGDKQLCGEGREGREGGREGGRKPAQCEGGKAGKKAVVLKGRMEGREGGRKSAQCNEGRQGRMLAYWKEGWKGGRGREGKTRDPGIAAMRQAGSVSYIALRVLTYSTRFIQTYLCIRIYVNIHGFT